MKRIIIIGGGYAGTMLARALDAVAEIVVVEPKESFIHNVAAIRAVVDPAWLERLILPYGHLLKRGRVVQDRVTSIGTSGVQLESQGGLEGDIIIAATGSSYAQPFKAGGGVPAFRKTLLDTNAQLKSARDVVIIGAGSVGIELAGEIATGMSGKNITLVSASPTLLPGFKPKLGARLLHALQSLGVTVRLGAAAEGMPAGSIPGPGTITLAGQAPVAADILFTATGARPETTLLRTLPGMNFDAQGRVVVDPWLRPIAGQNLFALGDAAVCGDMMTIVAVSRQAPWLAKTITAMLQGPKPEALPPYRPWTAPPILVPLGLAAWRQCFAGDQKGAGRWWLPDIGDQGQGAFHPTLSKRIRLGAMS
jgi:NADH dehydrogenase FAD-containing subunit